MMRAVFAGLSLVALSIGALSLGACAPSVPAQDKPSEPVAKMPVEMEDKYATSEDGTKIHYVASGQGPLVVLIHGYPDFSGSWTQLTPKLNDAYRVVALDTRGYNLSDKPEGVANYAMPKLVQDVDAVIKAEGAAKATIIGHDWGSAITWQYALAHPEVVERVVAMSVPHPAAFSAFMATSKEQQASSGYARNFQKEGSEKELTAEGLAGWVKDPEMKPKYVEAFGRSSFAGMMNYYRANYPSAPPPADAPPPQMPKIDVPVLVIHGLKDNALLAGGHNNTWNYISKETTLVMIPEAGHWVQHDAADEVNATIRNWLEMHPVK